MLSDTTCPHTDTPFMRRAATALALAGVLLAGGCGGDGGDGLSKSEYIAEADAICRSAQAQAAAPIQSLTATVSGSPSRTRLRKAARIVAELQTIGTSYLTRLRALEQPADDTTAIERFLAPTGRVVGMLSEARDALERGAAVEALGVLQKAQPLDAEAGSAARAYGFKRCGSLISAASSPAA